MYKYKPPTQLPLCYVCKLKSDLLYIFYIMRDHTKISLNIKTGNSCNAYNLSDQGTVETLLSCRGMDRVEEETLFCPEVSV